MRIVSLVHVCLTGWEGLVTRFGNSVKARIMIKKCTVHCPSFKLLVSYLMGRVSELDAGLALSMLKICIKNDTSSLKVTKKEHSYIHLCFS